MLLLLTNRRGLNLSDASTTHQPEGPKSLDASTTDQPKRVHFSPSSNDHNPNKPPIPPKSNPSPNQALPQTAKTLRAPLNYPKSLFHPYFPTKANQIGRINCTIRSSTRIT